MKRLLSWFLFLILSVSNLYSMPPLIGRMANDKYGYIFFCKGTKGTFGMSYEESKKIEQDWADHIDERIYMVCIMIDKINEKPILFVYIYQQDPNTKRNSLVYKCIKNIVSSRIYAPKGLDEHEYGLVFTLNEDLHECVFLFSNFDCEKYEFDGCLTDAIPDEVVERSFDIDVIKPNIDIRFDNWQFYADIFIAATNNGKNELNDLVVSWLDVMNYMYEPIKDLIKK